MTYGTDLLLKDNELPVAANGEALLVYEADTVAQDIFIRLSTYRGTLFYDPEYGSYLYDYILEEDTRETRLALCDEITRRVEEEPRVKAGSPKAKITAYTVNSVTVEITFELIGTDTSYNLTLSLDKTLKDIKYVR